MRENHVDSNGHNVSGELDESGRTSNGSDSGDENENEGEEESESEIKIESEEENESIRENESENEEENDGETETAILGAITTNSSPPKYGCQHYRRRAKLVAPCCQQVFFCRHCHNDAMDINHPDPRLAHKIDRHAVAEVVCSECNTRQPKSDVCIACSIKFAAYYCATCSFYDDEISKGFFHCEQCGICRVGGRENFFHCPTCNCCFPHSIKESHKCFQDALKKDCPVCLDFLFDSTHSASVLKCGHTIHSHCFQKWCRVNSFQQCPVCKKNNLSDPERVWEQYDTYMTNHPMPEEYKDMPKQTILCNDCLVKSHVPFSFIAHKCEACQGYNTDVVVS
uniref:Uncharacterized protein n=1 Tax=Polytomella parva TaxID=51329 RepID=A0A7S0YK97_9CHLO|mmetsp:Transcript_30686/g.55878  ORF Transcript_30686/g.55878 Transcript_30686/m.55878 type:complete len:339 (+) Transcript_30686:54-1070(+)